jgi:beta-1,4-N-acetylglucosaminyltransferase
LIFVTIGTMYGFERLIRWMDIIASKLNEDVVMQIGNTAYTPINSSYFLFVSKEKLDYFYAHARVVVCHAGVGSLLSAMEHGKPVIAVPRKKELGEALDNHQLEISNELGQEGLIRVAYNFEDLEKEINTISSINSEFKLSSDLVISLKNYIDQLVSIEHADESDI